MGSIRSLNNLIEIREEEDDYVSFFYFFVKNRIRFTCGQVLSYSVYNF